MSVAHEQRHQDPRWPVRPPEWRPPGLPDPHAPLPSRLPLLMPAAEGFETDLASRLLRRRIVLLTGRIDALAASNAVATLLLLDEDDNRAIRLHLSSDDVDVEAGSLVADTVDMLASPVHAVALGAVGGAGLGALAAATARTAHPQALFVLRDPQHHVALGAGDVDAGRAAGLADQQQRLVARLHERIAEATGRPAEQVAADMRAGRVLTAAEAVAYGLVQQLAAAQRDPAQRDPGQRDPGQRDGRSGADGLH
jgi:ATP-dependent Clp protease, protease subunit